MRLTNLTPILNVSDVAASLAWFDALAALAGYTTAAAVTIGEETRLGRIRAGFAADITVFADDPVECDADELPELPVVLTLVDGEIVHRAD